MRVLGDRRQGERFTKDGATLLTSNGGRAELRKPLSAAAAGGALFLRVSAWDLEKPVHDVLQNCPPSPFSPPPLTLTLSSIMAGIRPPVLEAALRSCTRARRAPALRNAPFSKRSPGIQRRWIGDTGGRPPIPPGGEGRNTVVAPKTRMAVGVVFIGALIYSMVQDLVQPMHINGSDD